MKKYLTIACPNCQKEIAWDTTNPFRPFCSKRCKLIDLGDWINEKNVIAGDSVDVISNDLLNNEPTQ